MQIVHADILPALIPLIPLGCLIILWLIQGGFVLLLRRRLAPLWTRHPKFTGFIYGTGTFFHELSHALAFLITGSGVSRFRVGREGGEVVPGRIKPGFSGWFSYFFSSLAPYFFPPLLLIIYVVVAGYLIDWNFIEIQIPSIHGSAIEISMGYFTVVLGFLKEFGFSMINLDLFQLPDLLFFILMLIMCPGSKSSYISEKHEGKRIMGGDMAVLLGRLKSKPHYLLLIILILYAIYFGAGSLFLPVKQLYFSFWLFMGFLSVIALYALIMDHLLISWIKGADRSRFPFLIYPAFPISYIGIRYLSEGFSFPIFTQIPPLIISMLITAMLCILLHRKKQ